MRYLFLGYSDETKERTTSADERRRNVEEHMAFGARMRAEGRLVAGVGLEDSAATTVVRLGLDGDDLITDGPFVEAREQIGGLYILECANLDEAIALARQIPRGHGVTVEIRPAPA